MGDRLPDQGFNIRPRGEPLYKGQAGAALATPHLDRIVKGGAGPRDIKNDGAGPGGLQCLARELEGIAQRQIGPCIEWHHVAGGEALRLDTSPLERHQVRTLVLRCVGGAVHDACTAHHRQHADLVDQALGGLPCFDGVTLVVLDNQLQTPPPDAPAGIDGFEVRPNS
ncbi:hypothetical protein FQZ97_838910 [compost metagenome]